MRQSPPSTSSTRCPTCGKPVDLSERTRHRPFCSERCRLIDLGEWASEGYRLSSPLTDQQVDTDGPLAEHKDLQ